MEKRIVDHLKSHDSMFLPLLEKYSHINLIPSCDYFSDLVNSIVCQQLSDKAGAAIWKRFQTLFGEEKVNPKNVSGKSIEELRRSGVSHSKAQYIKNVAEAFMKHSVQPKRFTVMTDEEIIAELTQIKGIGRWTAEMFCIFSLGREDIFSTGDLGLSNALAQMNGRTRPYTKNTMERMGRKWAPFRSYASLLLWKSLEK